MLCFVVLIGLSDGHYKFTTWSLLLPAFYLSSYYNCCLFFFHSFRSQQEKLQGHLDSILWFSRPVSLLVECLPTQVELPVFLGFHNIGNSLHPVECILLLHFKNNKSLLSRNGFCFPFTSSFRFTSSIRSRTRLPLANRHNLTVSKQIGRATNHFNDLDRA